MSLTELFRQFEFSGLMKQLSDFQVEEVIPEVENL